MLQGKKSEADWAIEILLQENEAMFYYDLLSKIADKMNKEKDPGTLASIYTRINMDNRLIYQGEGYWYFDSNRIRKP
jgi:DNA-directed RNA polymerase subunit delta